MSDAGGLLAVLVLVAANGFFVAAEFSLVAVRRSRVIELAASGRINAKALVRALDHLDSNLAATQLGITISSLALGWIGEPAIAHLIEEPLSGIWGTTAGVSAYAVAVGISFVLITALHIVLGELAPKSLALQRSEGTALWVIRPLGLFRWLLSPAILLLNGMGNLVLRLCGLRPGTGEESLHSAGEIKLLVEASQDAGLLLDAQEEVMVRTLEIGNRRIGEIMTPRTDLDWIDLNDSRDEIAKTVLESPYEQMLVGHGSIDNLLGAVTKTDLLNQMLRGEALDPGAAVAVPLMVHEAMPIFKVLEQFKKTPVRLAVVVDEYGGIEGIVTQADLLEALAGDIPEMPGERPDVVEREDGSLLIEGMAPVQATLDRLQLRVRPVSTRFHTIAGFALAQLGHLPVAGERFSYEDWTFEILDMDGRRIDKLLARRAPTLDA